ncbi:alkylated DNA repair protein alkB homolog 8-like [Watersipora subatra]|uniref:alkylated DNA repair protein alkB homolog 8-like n=1 Tax=Watersipora subatra TaxID=2589382 RepID=UPI00355BAFE6
MENEHSSKRQQNRLRRKEAKCKAQLSKQLDFSPAECTTKMLCVSNAGLGNGLTREHVYTWLSGYGTVAGIVMEPKKPYCYVITGDVTDATTLLKLSGGRVQHEGIPQPVEHFIFCVSNVPELPPPRSELPSGLHLLNDYISPEVEEQLLGLVDWGGECLPGSTTGSSSGGSMKHRSVKHYGYEFKYSTNNVDPNDPLANQIPDECKQLTDRLIKDGYLTDPPDQLTVNKYEPGQGIPPHVDTHSAFIGPIVSLSLGSQVIMTFSNSLGDTRQVLLPRRSVLVMAGESRYSWSHSIVPRKTDVVESAEGLTLSYRQTRVSFTFRRLRRARCQCDYPAQCDSQNYGETRECSGDSKIAGLTAEAALRLEELHVHKVYDSIASHFSGTRHSQWPKVAEFLSSLPSGSLLADIGCGNGKYLRNTPNLLHFKIGFERSRDLSEICQSMGYPIVQADCLATPLLDECMDACLCIAVIHHLSTQERRKAAIAELLRIVRPGGRCLIYVWAMEQRKAAISSSYLKPQSTGNTGVNPPEYLSTVDGDCQLPVHRNRTEFASADMLVPWNLKSKPDNKSEVESENKVSESNINHQQAPANHANVEPANSTLFHRYYHIFKEGELEALCTNVEKCRILESYYDQGNWCVILTKDH